MPVLGRWNADDDDKPGQRASGSGWRYDDSESPPSSSSDSNADSESVSGVEFLGKRLVFT